MWFPFPLFLVAYLMEKTEMEANKDTAEAIKLPHLSALARDGTHVGYQEAGKETYVAVTPSQAN